MLITWGVFSVAAGLLCEGIIDIGWDLLKGYRGRLSESLGWTKQFFFLMPLIFARGLAMAAPVAFCAEGLFAARLEGNRRWRTVWVASLGYIGLALAVTGVYMLVAESGLSVTSRDLKFMISMLVFMLLALVFPVGAICIFGFWLPIVVTGVYCRLSKHPRWWLAGLLGTLTLLAGVLFWSVMGTLVGAATD